MGCRLGRGENRGLAAHKRPCILTPGTLHVISVLLNPPSWACGSTPAIRCERSSYCSSRGEAFSFLFSENLEAFRDGVKTAPTHLQRLHPAEWGTRAALFLGGHILGGWPGKATAPAGLNLRESLNVPQSHRCHTPRSPTLASA